MFSKLKNFHMGSLFRIPSKHRPACLGWAYEVLALISGVLGTTSLAATTVAMQVFNVAFNIPVGVSIGKAFPVEASLPSMPVFRCVLRIFGASHIWTIECLQQ